ncbi:MAG: hypothetical protein ACRC1D_10390, partial [Culicoidibacterales bacterium]
MDFAQTSADYVEIVNHRVVSTACLERLLTFDPDAAIIKLIFNHHCATIETMKMIATAKTRLKLFQMYTIEEFQSALKHVKNSEKLGQYARIALSSEFQLAILQHPALIAANITTLFIHNPSDVVLTAMVYHQLTPAPIRQQIAQQASYKVSVQQAALQSKTAFFNAMKKIKTLDELNKQANLARTSEMQLAIMQHHCARMSTLAILIKNLDEHVAQKAVMMHSYSTERIVQMMLIQMSKADQQHVLKSLDSAEFDALMNRTKTTRTLQIFAAYANTAFKQMVIIRHSACDAQCLDILQNIVTEAYVLQKISKLRTEQPDCEVLDQSDLLTALDQRKKIILARKKDADLQAYFEVLVYEKNPKIRQALVENPAVASKIIEILTRDSDTKIARTATRKLKKIQAKQNAQAEN